MAEYKEDVIKDTLHAVHKEIVAEYRKSFKSVRGTEIISLNDFNVQLDEILHKVLRSPEGVEKIIGEVMGQTAS